MKLRMGFVSNSSSCSFLAVYMPNKKIKNGFCFEAISGLIHCLNTYGEGADVEDRKDVIYERLFTYNQQSELKKKLNDMKFDDKHKLVYINFNMHTPIVKELVEQCEQLKIINEDHD